MLDIILDSCVAGETETVIGALIRNDGDTEHAVYTDTPWVLGGDSDGLEITSEPDGWPWFQPGIASAVKWWTIAGDARGRTITLSHAVMSWGEPHPDLSLVIDVQPATPIPDPTPEPTPDPAPEPEPDPTPDPAPEPTDVEGKTAGFITKYGTVAGIAISVLVLVMPLLYRLTDGAEAYMASATSYTDAARFRIQLPDEWTTHASYVVNADGSVTASWPAYPLPLDYFVGTVWAQADGTDHGPVVVVTRSVSGAVSSVTVPADAIPAGDVLTFTFTYEVTNGTTRLPAKVVPQPFAR